MTTLASMYMSLYQEQKTKVSWPNLAFCLFHMADELRVILTFLRGWKIKQHCPSPQSNKDLKSSKPKILIIWPYTEKVCQPLA